MKHNGNVVIINSESPQDDMFLDHVESPYHRGHVNKNAVRQTARNPFCGDRIEVQLLIGAEDEITEAWHDGVGCITSLAAASILCEHIEGRSLSSLRNFTKQEMLRLLGIQLTPLRQHCALVVYNALQAILVDRKSSVNAPISQEGSGREGSVIE